MADEAEFEKIMDLVPLYQRNAANLRAVIERVDALGCSRSHPEQSNRVLDRSNTRCNAEYS